MAFNFGGKIVGDGLVLYLDAANRNSYVSGSNNWNDLSQNRYNGSLLNGPTFSSANGGSIVFDGVNDYVTRNLIDTGQNFTAAAWVRPTVLSRGAIIGNSYNLTGRNGWLLATAAYYNNNGNFYISLGSDVCVVASVGSMITTNNWNYITATVSDGGNSIKLYKNGIETSYSTLNTSPGTITYTTNEFNVGYRFTGNPEPFSGNIASVKIYNRVLSAQEVLQNYNALKGRYGL